MCWKISAKLNAKLRLPKFSKSWEIPKFGNVYIRENEIRRKMAEPSYALHYIIFLAGCQSSLSSISSRISSTEHLDQILSPRGPRALNPYPVSIMVQPLHSHILTFSHPIILTPFVWCDYNISHSILLIKYYFQDFSRIFYLIPS